MSQEKVIGGEFRIEADHIQKLQNMDPYRANWQQSDNLLYASGRTALYAILSAIPQTRGGWVCIPDYICSSVVSSVAQQSDYRFYKIKEDLMPDIDSLSSVLGNANSVLFVNYFGLLDLSDAIQEIRNSSNDCVIICDDVQNFYGCGREADFDYAFNSQRKWFAVPDGAAIVSRNENIPCMFREEAPFVRYKLAGNLLKHYSDFVGDDVCLKLLQEGENALDGDFKYRCSGVGKKLMALQDINGVAKKRKRNGRFLHENLTKMGINHSYRRDAVPMFIPIFIENRDAVRKRLAARNIFCPVHWPRDSHTSHVSNRLYDNELSLVCDQRYDEEDMQRILEVIA